MKTFLVIVVVLVLGARAYRAAMSTGRASDVRKMYAWAWALVGAAVGSFFGVAGFGNAINGAIPGAIVGWLFGSNLNKRDYESEYESPDSPIYPIEFEPRERRSPSEFVEEFVRSPRVQQGISSARHWLKTLATAAITIVVILVVLSLVVEELSRSSREAQNSPSTATSGAAPKFSTPQPKSYKPSSAPVYKAPKPKCIIKPVMTDAEIQTCRDSG